MARNKNKKNDAPIGLDTYPALVGEDPTVNLKQATSQYHKKYTKLDLKEQTVDALNMALLTKHTPFYKWVLFYQRIVTKYFEAMKNLTELDIEHPEPEQLQLLEQLSKSKENIEMALEHHIVMRDLNASTWLLAWKKKYFDMSDSDIQSRLNPHNKTVAGLRNELKLLEDQWPKLEHPAISRNYDSIQLHHIYRAIIEDLRV